MEVDNVLKAKYGKTCGQVKGGKLAYSKNKLAFKKGRIKGLKKLRLNDQSFDINMPLSKKLCEIVGLFVGDGFANKYDHSYHVQFTGHIDEEQYYKTVIIPYIKNLFSLDPKLAFENKSNAIRVKYYSKYLFLLFTKRFKIKKGKKSKIVLIPEEILNSDKKYLLSFVRGFYDAEASVYFDKRKIYVKPYPIIEVHLNNPRLINQLSNVLTKYSITNSVRDRNSRLYIYGYENVKKYVRDIGFSNPKHLNKVTKLL